MNEESVLLALASHVPELLIFLLLTYVFMRSQQNIVREFTSYMRKKDGEIDETIQKNSGVIRENTKVLGAALRVFEGGD